MKGTWLQRVALTPQGVRQLDPTGIGIIFGIIATLGYTLAGIVLRDLADDTDPYWVSCIKAIPTLIVALWLIRKRQSKAEQPIEFSFKLIPLLFAIGVIVQIGGNVGSQWAFEVIGLAITIPLMFGTLITGSAVIGILMFNERLTRRRVLAVALLTAAVSVLSFAARSEEQSLEETSANRPDGAPIHQTTEVNAAAAPTTSLAALGVLVACASGIAYAVSHAAIRKYTSPKVPLSVPLAIFSIAGILVLGGLSYWRLGWDGLAGTTANQWWRLWAAGVINAVAYFSLGRAIQALPLVQVNIITASQVALNAVAGILIFAEPVSAALVAGVVLTMIGLMIQGRKTKARPAEAAPDDEV